MHLKRLRDILQSESKIEYIQELKMDDQILFKFKIKNKDYTIIWADNTYDCKLIINDFNFWFDHLEIQYPRYEKPYKKSLNFYNIEHDILAIIPLGDNI